MPRVYTAGRRYDTLIICCITIETVLIMAALLTMYLTGLHPTFTPLKMLIYFVIASAAAGGMIWFVGKRTKAYIRYEVASDCLVVSAGSRLERYPWASFTAAYLDKKRKKDPLPMVLEAAGRVIYLNQYVDGIYSLGSDILRHIGASAVIDPELVDLIR